MKDYLIGFDLGGTKMLAAIFDRDLNKIHEKKQKTRPKDAGSFTAKDGVKRMAGLIEKTLEEADISPEQVAAIGFGAPGPIDIKKGIIVDTPNLGWSDVKLGKEIKERFGVPVAVANDVDVGVYGEYIKGAGKDAEVLLGAFPGTGLGGGLVARGEIYNGARLSCMEIGHVKFQPGGAPCGCSKEGCLETLTSRLAISREIAAQVVRGNAPVMDGIAGADIREMKSSRIAEAADKDKAVERVVKSAMRRLGEALGGYVNILAPDLIVIGGGLVEAMPKLVIKELKSSAEDSVMSAYRGSFDIVKAELGDDAGITGAAGIALKIAGS